MKRLTFFLLALGIWSARATDFNVYCSTTNTTSGDGTFGNPYRALSFLAWTALANQISAGNTVRINLQRGSVFREQLTVGASGSPSAHVVFQAYQNPLNTNNPVVASDDVVAGFTQYPTSTTGAIWTSTVAVPVSYLFASGVRLGQGAGLNTLRNHQWYWLANSLYLRWDEGNPDVLNMLMEATTRSISTSVSGFRYVDFFNIDMRRASGPVINLISGSNITLVGCRLSQGNLLLDLNNSAAFTAKGCVFEEGYGSDNSIRIEAPNSNFAYYYCLFHNFNYGDGISIFGGQGGAFVNCSFVGCGTYHIVNFATNSNVAAVNCIFSGVNTAPISGGRPAIDNLAGTFVLTNCLVMACGKSPTFRLTGVSEYGTVWGEPQYVSTRHPAIVAFGRDDSGSIDAALTSSALLKTYGWGMSYAFSSGGAGLVMNQSVTNKLRSIVANGSEITCHGREDVDFTEARAIRLQYIGSGSTATLSVSSNMLITKVNGSVDRSLNLSSSNYATLGGLVSALNAGNYVCTWPQTSGWFPYSIPSRLLTNTVDQDILSAPVTVLLDYPAYLNYELVFSKSELESILGSGYTVTGIAYGLGKWNGTVTTNAQNAGYMHGRTDTPEPYGGYLLASNNVFLLDISPDVTGVSAVLPLEGSAADGSVAGNHFNATGVVYSTTVKYRGAYSAYFDGTAAYLSRPSNTSFDFSWGDWLYCTHLYPTGIGGTQTLFSNGNSAQNGLRIYLDGQGVVHVDAVTNGVPVVSFSSGNIGLTNEGWQKVSVQETYNNWFLRINDVLVAVTNSLGRLQNFGDLVYLGCGYDFDHSARIAFYKGYLDDVDIADRTYYYTQSTLDQICEEGCFAEVYGHDETNDPNEIWRVVFDAVQNFSGRVVVMTEGAATDYLLTNGVRMAFDGQTLLRTNAWIPAGDYRLRASSPARGAGILNPLLGQTNLFDLAGIQITGPDGQLLRNSVSLGAYEYDDRSAGQAPVLVAAGYSGGTFSFSLAAETGVNYAVQSTQNLDGSAWTTLRVLSGNGSLMRFSDPAPTATQRFYRVAVIR